MASASRLGSSRNRVQRFMSTPIVITRGGSPVFSGFCSYRAAEANQGQLSEPDPAEADVGSYQSYDIWIKYDSTVLGDILEGDLCKIDNRINLTITAVEEDATDKTAIQLRAVKQRTASPRLSLTMVRVDPISGATSNFGPYTVQVVLDSPTPFGAGADVTGGSQSYIQGTLVFTDIAANVKAGDRFAYLGRWGEVTGIPTVANDRKEVRMRVAGGGF